MDNSGKNQKIANIFDQKNIPAKTGVNPFGSVSPAQNNFKIGSFDTKPAKRLNGYDSTILNKANFDNTESRDLSLDYRIKEKEAILKDLDERIKQAENYGTQNESLGLRAKQQRILQELSSLQKEQVYGSVYLGKKEKFSHSKFKKTMPVLYKIQEFISRHILAKVSKKINSIVTLNDSLEQLSDISRSVDELIDLNVPYGEKIQNYEKLTEYLNRANSIHSKISKSLRK